MGAVKVPGRDGDGRAREERAVGREGAVSFDSRSTTEFERQLIGARRDLGRAGRAVPGGSGAFVPDPTSDSGSAHALVRTTKPEAARMDRGRLADVSAS